MRQDDHEKKCYFRSSGRVFKMNGEWYFATREGDRGPFRTEVVAQAEIDRFITEQKELAHFQQAREREKKSPLKLELMAIDERPYSRPVKRSAVQRKVYI